MKVALGALLMSLVAFVGCSSDGDDMQPTEVVTETVTTETTEAQTVVDDMDKLDKKEVVAETDTDSKFVTTSLLNVRSGPGMSFGIVRVATFKEKLPAIESTGSWVKVGEGEYVSKNYLSDSEPSAPNDPAPRSDMQDTTTAPVDNTTEGTMDSESTDE